MELSRGDAPAAFPGPSMALQQQQQQDNVPVYVMLPLDTVNMDGVFRYATAKWFNSALQELKDTGIHGVAIDVWWGAVERRPRRYDWSGYRQLFDLVASLGLRLQVVIAFHACGGNVGDNAEVPLPPWVVSAGERDPDIFFTDRPRNLSPGSRNRECISLFADEEPALLKGRSPMQCYVDFMRSFRDEFSSELGGLVEEIVVGTGPCGELRYPSYPEANGWRFPGIGEFQCYDRRASASLARAAAAVGRPEWGNAGPHDAGRYNATPEETPFFRGWGGGWDSDYGRFFLSWYSGALIDHGDRMLNAATSVFNTLASPRSSSSDGGTMSPTGGGNGGGGGGGSGDLRSGSFGGVTGLGMRRTSSSLPRQGSAAMSDAGSRGSGGGNGSGNGNGNGLGGLASSSSLDGMATMASTPRGLPDTPGGGVGDFLGGLPPLPPRSEPPSSLTGPAPLGLPTTRPPSYSSFRSSSVSEGLNLLEDWAWPTPAGPAVGITLKIAGVHWWYRTRSHAAELAAGYYNCDGQDGYEPIIALCARHGVSMTLTCVEMCDAQHPPEALCGPEGLLRQIREAAAIAGVPLAGENALPCFMPNAIDEIALQRVVYNTQPWGTPLQQGAGGSDGRSFGGLTLRSELISTSESTTPSLQYRMPGPESAPPPDSKLPPMRAFTFLRLTPDMMTPAYQEQWERFMKLMARNAQKFRSSPGWRKNMGFL